MKKHNPTHKQPLTGAGTRALYASPVSTASNAAQIWAIAASARRAARVPGRTCSRSPSKASCNRAYVVTTAARRWASLMGRGGWRRRGEGAARRIRGSGSNGRGRVGGVSSWSVPSADARANRRRARTWSTKASRAACSTLRWLNGTGPSSWYTRPSRAHAARKSGYSATARAKAEGEWTVPRPRDVGGCFGRTV